jgi:Helix-turn-helix domain
MKHVDMRKLPAAAQEERRRQVIGLRQAGQTYDAIAAQVGLSPTGVFDICKRFAERGTAGLKTGPRGPAPGHGRSSTPTRNWRPATSSGGTRLTSWASPSRSGAGRRCAS